MANYRLAACRRSVNYPCKKKTLQSNVRRVYYKQGCLGATVQFGSDQAALFLRRPVLAPQAGSEEAAHTASAEVLSSYAIDTGKKGVSTAGLAALHEDNSKGASPRQEKIIRAYVALSR